MKTKLLALCLVLTSATFALDPIVTWASWKPDACNTNIELTIKYPTPLTCEISLAAGLFGQSPTSYSHPNYPFTASVPYYPTSNDYEMTHTITIQTPNPIFLYITVTDVNNPVNSTTKVVPVNPGRGPCTFPDVKKFYPVQTSDAYWDTSLHWYGYVFVPEDPNEADNPDMETKWNLQEVDLSNYGSAFSIDNTICWADANVPGASQTFNGFNGFDAATSISDLQAGNCTSDEGMFDVDKIYYVTRSYRMPGDDWTSFSMVVGPGCAYEVSDPDARALVVGTIPQKTTDLFTLGQNREEKTVIINTTVDIGTLEVYDTSGNKVRTLKLQKETFVYEINTSWFGKGLYLVRVQSGSQSTLKKFTTE